MKKERIILEPIKMAKEILLKEHFQTSATAGFVASDSGDLQSVFKVKSQKKEENKPIKITSLALYTPFPR